MMLTQRVAFTELSQTPPLYNDAGGQDPTRMTARLDPRNDYDTSSGLLNSGPPSYHCGVNTSARIRPTNPTQVTRTHQHVYSWLPSQGGQLLLRAWAVVPSWEHATLALRGQVYAPQFYVCTPGEGMDYDAVSQTGRNLSLAIL